MRDIVDKIKYALREMIKIEESHSERDIDIEEVLGAFFKTYREPHTRNIIDLVKEASLKEKVISALSQVLREGKFTTVPRANALKIVTVKCEGKFKSFFLKGLVDLWSYNSSIRKYFLFSIEIRKTSNPSMINLLRAFLYKFIEGNSKIEIDDLRIIIVNVSQDIALYDVTELYDAELVREIVEFSIQKIKGCEYNPEVEEKLKIKLASIQRKMFNKKKEFAKIRFLQAPSSSL